LSEATMQKTLARGEHTLFAFRVIDSSTQGIKVPPKKVD